MNYRAKVSFILIMLLAIWMRLPGLSLGLPYLYDEDEAHHLNRTVEMVRTGDLNPHYFLKPSLPFYLRLPFVGAGFLWEVKKGRVRNVKEIITRDEFGLGGYAFTASHPGVVKWVRGASLIAGLLVVTFAFLLAWELTASGFVAFWSGVVTAISPPLVEYSTQVGVDIFSACFATAAIYASVLLARNFSWYRFLAASGAAGLCVSCKYNLAPIVLVPVVAVVAGMGLKGARWALGALAVSVGFFFIGTPYALSSLPFFLDQVAYEVWHYSVAGHEGHQGDPGLSQLKHYLVWLGRDAIGVVLLLFALAGIAALLKRSFKVGIVVLVFPLLFLVLMSLQRANFTRNMLPIVPVIGIVAASGLCLVRDKLNHGVLFALILVGTFWSPFSNALSFIGGRHDAVDARRELESWLNSDYSRSDTSEYLIEGKLQLSPALERSPRISLYPQSSLSFVKSIETVEGEPVKSKRELALLPLFIAGFDRVVVSSAVDNIELAEAVKDIAGDDRLMAMRVVKNPRITVYAPRGGWQFSPATLEYLRSQERYRLPLIFSRGEDGVEGSISPSVALEFEAGAPVAEVGHQQGEAWHWMDSRLAVLADEGQLMRLLESGEGEVSSDIRVELEVMTPWKGQNVGILGGFSGDMALGGQADPNQAIAPKELEPGVWTRLNFTISRDELVKQGGIIVTASQVHSPANMRLSSDPRRLGVAIKAVMIQPKKGS